jgi:RNA polymerase sigma factor (sigma-70 family)
MDDPRTEEGLMLAYRDGDAAAFDVLYARLRGRLYRYLAHQAPGHADELFQDVWMKVINARAGYEVTAKFSTWLFRIAHNRLMDHFRAQGRSIGRSLVDTVDDPDEEACSVIDPPAPNHEGPGAMVERKQVAQQIMDALAALPDPQREAFLLAEEGGLSVEEIAQATGVGRETAKSRLRYALDRLRRALAGVRS